jgi:NADP-dependent 3-hydroxy acid dehydrogenase YdfG
MTTTTSQRQPDLTGQTVVTGGGADIGLQAARRARAEGAGLILTGRNLDRLKQAAAGLGAVSRAALNAASPAALEGLPGGLPKQAGRVMVMAAGPAVR